MLHTFLFVTNRFLNYDIKDNIDIFKNASIVKHNEELQFRIKRFMLNLVYAEKINGCWEVCFYGFVSLLQEIRLLFPQ